MSRRRLEFEPLRDAILHVSGGLSRRMGGPPVELESNRRSIYLFIDRQDPDPVLGAFDVPNADASNGSRTETTVPQQSLFLLNHPFLLRAAE